jgi:hypothetical protein
MVSRCAIRARASWTKVQFTRDLAGFHSLHVFNIVKTWLLAATVAVAACAGKPPAEPVVRDQLLQRTATVEAVYLPTRMVSLRGDDGRKSSLLVGPEVVNLDQVEVGDRLIVSYYQGVAAEMKKPGEEAKEEEEELETVVAPPGARPAGATSVTQRTTVTIDSVDTSFNTVTFRRADGLIRTLAVEDSKARAFLRKLRPGDEVEVTYTEAIAVEVRQAAR